MILLHNQVIDKTRECLAQAEARLGQSFSMPTVNFNQRGKVAGSARLQGWEVRFNPVLLAENPAEFLTEVVPHEVAHLLTFKLFGRVKPHGPEWQTMMTQVFGIPARTTHHFDTQSVQGKTFPYTCACCEHQLTVRRHNKVLRQQAIYHCTQCRQPLMPQP